MPWLVFQNSHFSSFNQTPKLVMSKTTPELVEDILSNYKENMSWILLVFAIFSALLSASLQYVQNLKLAKKVEEYKNELSQKELKFTRHTEMQIECLKKMYDQVVTFHFSFTNLINPIYKTHGSLKKNIKSFQDIFNQTMHYSHRNKILLTEDIIKQIGIIHTKFKKIEILCRSEYDNLNQLEDHNNTDEAQYLYTTEIEEVEFIQLAIERLNENQDVKSFEAEILKLRASIENYFKKLVG